MNTGEVYGRWTVICAYPEDGSKSKAAQCLCECGAVKLVERARLKKGKSQSCGCLRNELTSAREKTHGLGHSNIYKVWGRMLSRCHNEVDPKFKSYGGRGIFVCDRWRNSVEEFYADVGDRPFEGASLDRIDNNLGYSPTNVKWSTPTQQARNKTTTTVVTFQGKERKLIELCEESGIKYRTAKSRLALGWAVNDVFTVQVGVKRG